MKTIRGILLIGLVGSLASVTSGQSTALPSGEGRPLPPLFHNDSESLSTAQPRWRLLLEKHVYGRRGKGTCDLRLEPVRRPDDDTALEGLALRRQFRLEMRSERGAVTANLLVYLPANSAGPVPVFVGLNFYGNQTIWDDPEIVLPTSWIRNNPSLGITANRATEASRGGRQSCWPVDEILARGYGLATAYYGDFEPDREDGFDEGVRSLFDSASIPAAERWGSIAGWAWGLSQIADALASLPEVNRERLVVLGHSRLGKTALWAGATDERFAITISNNSGCGGAALSRREVGESVARINEVFPYWFCPQFHTYGERVAALPVDQHFLIAACAPRPVYVASASEDTWADPVGEFLALQEARPAFERAGCDVSGLDLYPKPDRRIGATLGYHVRTGKHDVTPFDWQQFMDFADSHFSDR